MQAGLQGWLQDHCWICLDLKCRTRGLASHRRPPFWASIPHLSRNSGSHRRPQSPRSFGLLIPHCPRPSSPLLWPVSPRRARMTRCARGAKCESGYVERHHCVGTVATVHQKMHTHAGTHVGVFGSHHDDGGAAQPRSMLSYGLPRPLTNRGSTAREIDSVVAPRPNCGQLEGPTPEAVPLLWSVHWAPCRQVWSAGVSRTDRSLRVASLGGESFGRAGRDWPQKWP